MYGQTGFKVWFQLYDPNSLCIYIILYVQEVGTLQKKYLIYLHQKMRFTPFINYYDTLG